MKKLLCAMASIALLTSPVAIAQPDHQQGQQHENRGQENRGGGNRQDHDRQGQDRQAAQRQMGQRQAAQRQNAAHQMGRNQAAERHIVQRQMGQRQAAQRQDANRRMGQRQAAQRQAANRVYNVSTYRTYNYSYADPTRYRNNGVHRGWAQDRGNAYRWSEGERMGYNDRYYAPRVSYRRYHLRRPPYGYEWRRYDDRYVLVAITSGLIMSVILNAGR